MLSWHDVYVHDRVNKYKDLSVAYDLRELHKNSDLKIVNMGMSEAAQNSQQSEFGRSKFQDLKNDILNLPSIHVVIHHYNVNRSRRVHPNTSLSKTNHINE
jgi:hypothetical protein